MNRKQIGKEFEQAVKPVAINVTTSSFKLERMKNYKELFYMDWEEFIFDLFFEFVNSFYFGMSDGIQYSDGTAFQKFVEKWGNVIKERKEKLGY